MPDGKGIDTDLMATILCETSEGSQFTSRIVTIPHAILLVKPLRNLTATGTFALYLLRITVDVKEDLLALEALLLEAANEVCGPWMERAEDHLRRFEARELMNLPSASPRVIIELNNSEESTLSLRYCCHTNQRVNVEQAILRQYIKKRTENYPMVA